MNVSFSLYSVNKSHVFKFIYKKVSDTNGELSTTKVAEGAFSKEILKTTDCYILDANQEIYIWVGKSSSKQTRKELMLFAQKFLKETNKPLWIRIIRGGKKGVGGGVYMCIVPEGGETALFKEYFRTWDDTRAIIHHELSSNIAHVEQKAIDINGIEKGFCYLCLCE